MTPEQIAKLPRAARDYIAVLERQVRDGEEQIQTLVCNTPSSIRVTGIGHVDNSSPFLDRCLYVPEKVRPKFRVDDPKFPGHHIEVAVEKDRTLEISTTLGRLIVMPQVTNVIRVSREFL